MQKEFWKSQVSYISEACKRSRWILTVSSIASLAIIGTTYVFIFGFSRLFSKQLIFENDNEFMGEKGSVIEHLQKEVLKSWVDQFSMNFSILGVKYSVLDSGVIGVTALLIISIWQYFALRRENHLIGRTFIMASREKHEIKTYVYNGTAANIVMGGISGNDEAILDYDSKGDEIREGPGKSRWLIVPIFFMPAIAIAITIAGELITIFIVEALFRGERSSLYSYLERSNQMTTETQLHLFLPLFLETIVFIITMVLSLKSYGFQLATIYLLRKCRRNGWSEPEEATGNPNNILCSLLQKTKLPKIF